MLLTVSAELVYDSVEGSTYIVGAQTAMVSRTLSSDFEKTWRDSRFPDWGAYSVSPTTYIHVWKSNMIVYGGNCSILLAVHS